MIRKKSQTKGWGPVWRSSAMGTTTLMLSAAPGLTLIWRNNTPENSRVR